jgi:hypothetical protein
MSTTTASSYLRRLIGATVLDVGAYEEIEGDRGATMQAFVTVVLSAIAAGIGIGGYSLTRVVFISIVSLLAWAAWALVTFEVGVRLMPRPQTQSDLGELMRTLGFASAPGLLRIFGALPGARVPAFVISSIWMLAATVVAVRQSLDYESTARAIAVCALGWALAMAIAVGLGTVFAPAVY